MSAGTIITIMRPIIAVTALGVFGWATRRILARIGALGDKLEGLGTRLTVVETKQDYQVAAARTTAAKVGARPPRAHRGAHMSFDPIYRPERRPASKGLFVAALTLGSILIVVVLWCVLNPIGPVV